MEECRWYVCRYRGDEIEVRIWASSVQEAEMKLANHEWEACEIGTLWAELWEVHHEEEE